MPGVEVFDRNAERYDAWFERHPHHYEAELRALRALMPKVTCGIEVGVGTGRFAVPLGIRWGMDPSIRMVKMAKARGLQVVASRAEDLPSKDCRFDLILFVTTICFLNEVETALGSAYRALRGGGILLIGMFDRTSPLGSTFIRENQGSIFFRTARFYSVESVVSLMRKIGFKEFEFRQTIFHPTIETERAVPVEEGYGRGLFVAIKANKE
jgi:SAM-dependent methyltransferase